MTSGSDPTRRSLSRLLGNHAGNGHSAVSASRQLVSHSGAEDEGRAWRSTLDSLAPPSASDNGFRRTPPPAPAHTPAAAGPEEDLRRMLYREHPELIRRLHAEAAQALADRRRERDAQAADPDNTDVTTSFSSTELEQLGTRIAEDVVQRYIDDTINLGHIAPPLAEQHALVRAVCDNLFRLGPLQPLVDEPDVENILLTGGSTTVMYGDGSSEQRDHVFEHDDAAIDWVRKLAANAPGGGRPFALSNPALRLNLASSDGNNIRLSAVGWAVNRGVSIAIRKHLHKNITLNQLVDMDVMPQLLADMLRAATLAGFSVVASGPMGVGKTTLVRALCAELPIQTRIGTAELVRELYLHELPGRSPYVVSAEVVTGGGERNEWTDQLKGRFDLHQILQEFVSQQLDRVIVGEVAGREILALFKAMQMARGSLSTVHAYTCRGAIDRLVTLALEEPGVDETYAIRQVAAHIQIIVQMNTHWIRTVDGKMISRRHISELAWVEPGENARPAVSILYRRLTPDTEPQWGSLPPTLRDRIDAYGFDTGSWPHFDLDERVI